MARGPAFPAVRRDRRGGVILQLGQVDARQRQAGDDEESQQLEQELQVTDETRVSDAHSAAATRQPERLRPAAGR